MHIEKKRSLKHERKNSGRAVQHIYINMLKIPRILPLSNHNALLLSASFFELRT